MDPHPGSEHKIAVMLPCTFVYFRCLSRYLAPYIGSNVAGQEGHFIFSRGRDEDVGDVEGGGGGDVKDRLFGLLVRVGSGVADECDGDDDGAKVYFELWMKLLGEVVDMDDGRDDSAEVYLDLAMRLLGEMGNMNDVVSGSDGGSEVEDDDFEVIAMNPVGDIGEIGEPDDVEGILVKLGVVAVGEIGEESNSDRAVAVSKSELASLSV